MPDIAITAAITDGKALLFEEPASGRLRLPTLPFTDEHDEIEQALAAYLRERMGVVIVEQQFVDTVFERQGGGVVVNNVQLVTEWTGEVPARDVVGIALHWVPLAEVSRLAMSDDLRQTLAAALGMQSEDEAADDASETGGPGRVVVLTGPDEESVRVVAQNVPAALGRCALIEMSAIRGIVRPGPRDTHDAPGFPALMQRVRLLGLQHTAMLATNTAAQGIETIVYGTFAEAAELDALLTALLGTHLHVVQLAREGWRPDPRGMQIAPAPGGPADTAARIVERLDSARVA